MTLLDEPSGDRVGRGVHVGCKGGEVIVLGVDEGVYPVVLKEGQVVCGVVHRRAPPYRVKALGLPLLVLDLNPDAALRSRRSHRTGLRGVRIRNVILLGTCRKDRRQRQSRYENSNFVRHLICLPSFNVAAVPAGPRVGPCASLRPPPASHVVMYIPRYKGVSLHLLTAPKM